jgi:AcrR family transcriptional regulator
MSRPLRADAQRNRARLLQAAEEVFTEHGTDASTEDIARAAGVGVGTVFRHYPTKEALIEAVHHNLLQRITADARAADADAEPAALFTVFASVAQQMATKRLLAQALSTPDPAASDAARRDLRAAFDVLLRRARDAGLARADLGLPELLALLVGASAALEQIGRRPAARRRVLAAVLDGLRPR